MFKKKKIILLTSTFVFLISSFGYIQSTYAADKVDINCQIDNRTPKSYICNNVNNPVDLKNAVNAANKLYLNSQGYKTILDSNIYQIIPDGIFSSSYKATAKIKENNIIKHVSTGVTISAIVNSSAYLMFKSTIVSDKTIIYKRGHAPTDKKVIEATKSIYDAKYHKDLKLKLDIKIPFNPATGRIHYRFIALNLPHKSPFDNVIEVSTIRTVLSYNQSDPTATVWDKTWLFANESFIH